MNNKLRRFIVLILVLIFVLGSIYIILVINDKIAQSKATILSTVLNNYDFDDVEYDKSSNTLKLLKSVRKPNSSVLSYITVATLNLDDYKINNFPFRAARSIGEGTLFAIGITFDGEWDGYYIFDQASFEIPDIYILEIINDNFYLLNDVPSFYEFHPIELHSTAE